MVVFYNHDLQYPTILSNSIYINNRIFIWNFSVYSWVKKYDANLGAPIYSRTYKQIAINLTGYKYLTIENISVITHYNVSSAGFQGSASPTYITNNTPFNSALKSGFSIGFHNVNTLLPVSFISNNSTIYAYGLSDTAFPALYEPIQDNINFKIPHVMDTNIYISAIAGFYHNSPTLDWTGHYNKFVEKTGLADISQITGYLICSIQGEII